MAPLHIRVLLDCTRQKILAQTPHQSWDAFCVSASMEDLTDMVAQSTNFSPDLSSYICEFSNTRHQVSVVAHTASIEDVRSAVLQKPFDDERIYLVQLFSFVYDQPV